MRRDLVCSAILLCIAVLYYAAATGIQVSTLEDEVGPRGLPTVLAALLAMVAIIMGVRALVAAPAGAGSELEAESHWLRAIGMLCGDGLSVPGTGIFSIRSSAPVARFIARTKTSLLPAFDT